MKQLSRSVGAALFLWLISPLIARAQVSVLTYHNDNSRLGANLSEFTLTPENVNSTSFGKLFTYTVDGYVFAQPHYVSGLSIPGQGVHNVVFVATEHNSVYAFDADSNAGANGGLLWQVNLGPSAPSQTTPFPFQAIKPEVGITGTPVIDPGSQTLYVDAFTQNGTNFSHTIHALSLVDGTEKSFSPVLVTATVAGTGAGSTGGVLPFQAVQQLQRSALTLAGGVLYITFAGFTDTANTDPYHGWVLGYNASNLQLLGNKVFVSTPNGTTAQFGPIAGRGGVWMGGGGVASDGNNLFFSTGDGNFNAFPGSHGTEYGDSVIKLSATGALSVADYFTPYNQAFFQTNDLDVGSGGDILLPDQPGPFPHLMIAGGKPQRAYVINRDQMTSDNQHINTNGTVDNIVQTMPLGGGSFSTPSYLNGQIYYVASKDVIRGYALSNGTLIANLPSSSGSRTYAFPGATTSVSANGANNGIVWAIQNASPAVLAAYNATNLSTELYNSSQASGGRDQLTGGVKFAAPIVANGKVYAGSQMALSVFGLLNTNPSEPWQPINANYSGLFSQASGVVFGQSGSVSISTTKNGSFTAKLQFGAASYSLHGKFDASGSATVEISGKKTGAITVSLQVNTNDNSFISGIVSGNSWAANLMANQETFGGKGNPAPFAGQYRITFSGAGDNNPAHPQNNGAGQVTVSTSGSVKFKGMLGDGTKVSQSADVSADGDWPFFISLYGKQGEIMGWLNFNGSAISGQTTWIKLPSAKGKIFPDGFTVMPVVNGSE